MEFLTLRTGDKIPALGFGTYKLTGDIAIRAVEDALEIGYRHLDTAEFYENQKEIGVALKNSGIKREELFLTSKVWFTNLHYDDVLKACDHTLKELAVDYLDLYLIHWPNRNIPMEETFRAMARLVEEEMVKNIGVSNFTIAHLEKAEQVAAVPITVNQVEYHLYFNQKELLEYCQKKGLVLTAYNPLAKGRVLKDDRLQNIAENHGKSRIQVALKWLLQKGIVVIPRSSSREHIQQNFELFDWQLTNEELETLEGFHEGQRLTDPEWSEFETR